MNASVFLFVAFAIGVVSGLRALTAPAVISWAAHFQWIDLSHTWASFLGSPATPYILTVLAIAELANDLLPKTPPRTATPSFVIRLASGAFCGAALAAGTGLSAFTGVLFGAFGVIVGTFGGYGARTRLVRSLKVPDFVIALPEDAIAIGGGFIAASLLPH